MKQICRGLARCEERSRPHEKCINSVQLLGRVGNFPKKGKGNVWRFPLATNTSFYSKDEFGESKLVHKTQWHNIAIFKPYLQQKAEEMVTKGSRVLVHGRLDYVSYDDDEGNRRSYASVVLDDLILLASPEGHNLERNFDEDPDLEEMT